MGVDIRKKDKVEKIIGFAKRIKKVQKKAEAALRKTYQYNDIISYLLKLA